MSQAEFFFYSLGMGIFAFAPLADRKKTGDGLFKLVAAISLFSLLVGLILHPTNTTWGYYLMAIAASAFAWWSAFGWTVYIFHLAPMTYLLLKTQENPLYALSSIAFLGVVSYAMILGHWYLVTPRLSERPLLKALRIMWAVIFFKLALAGFALWQEGFSPQGWGSFNWVILTMRVLWGHIMIVGLGYYAHRLARMRSLQSATGVLYAMTFFVFAGEIMSHYLYHKFGLPL